jgi:hypothetical protein
MSRRHIAKPVCRGAVREVSQTCCGNTTKAPSYAVKHADRGPPRNTVDQAERKVRTPRKKRSTRKHFPEMTLPHDEQDGMHMSSNRLCVPAVRMKYRARAVSTETGHIG